MADVSVEELAMQGDAMSVHKRDEGDVSATTSANGRLGQDLVQVCGRKMWELRVTAALDRTCWIEIRRVRTRMARRS